MENQSNELFMAFRRINFMLHHGKGRRGFDGPPPHGRKDPHHGNAAHGQDRVVMFLYSSGEISQRDLTERLGIRPQSSGELLSKLEALGYVERRKNEKDRRIMNVRLTDAGAARAQELRNTEDEDASAFFSVLSGPEQDTLRSLLNKLIDENNRKENEPENNEQAENA